MYWHKSCVFYLAEDFACRLDLRDCEQYIKKGNLMRDFLYITRKLGGMASACFIVSATCGLPAYGQQSPQNNTASVAVGQKQENETDKIRMN
jgi:hypothetical protein